MTSGESVLKLRSRDNQLFEVEERVMTRSHTIKIMIQDHCAAGVIPVPRVDAKTLKLVIEWCKKHEDVEHNHEAGAAAVSELLEWETEFLALDDELEKLYDLIMAANYLDIADLLDKTAQKVADIIKEKTPEEIRKKFNIVNDFTPEEEEAIREQSLAFGILG